MAIQPTHDVLQTELLRARGAAVRRTQAPAFPDAGYRADIDGLRAVAVLAVVLHHLPGAWLPGGYVGVDVFFVISGYLIAGIVGREAAEGRFSFRRFYERRARRIFPALFAVLAATLAAAYVLMLPSDMLGLLQAAIGALLFASNIVFWQMEAGYFEQLDTRLNPLLHTWSLGVEEQFYLLFPVLLLVLSRWLPGRLALALGTFAAGSFVMAAALVQTNVSAAFYLSPFRAWELLAGAILATGAVPRPRSRFMAEVLVAGGLAAILAACALYDEDTLFPGAAAALPVLGAAAIIHGGSNGLTLAGRLLQARAMVYVGLISYSLYLWHWPVLVLAAYTNGMQPPDRIGEQLLLFAAALGLASASYHFVEQPFRRRPAAGARPRVAPGLLATATAAGLLVISVGGLLTAGYAHRFPAGVLALDVVRRAQVPHRDCSDREPAQACRLGAAGVEPTVLLWGDSHLIAWAPALDQALQRAGASALLVPATGCAPLLGTHSRIKPACADFNERVGKYFTAHPAIRTIVLSGFWSTYARPGGPLSMVVDGRTVDGLEAALAALDHTVRAITGSGRRAIIIGPVPAYDRDVPAVLALEKMLGSRLLDRSVEPQRSKHEALLAALARHGTDPLVDVVDPLAWFCRAECDVEQGSVSLYRDAHHLSVAGARHAAGPLGEALLEALARDRQARPAQQQGTR